MGLFRRLAYYARSMPVALAGFTNPFAIALAVARRQPFVVRLRTGERFAARTAMDAWVIKETCLDRDYERHGVKLRDGMAVVDIGAGLGDFAISVARRFPGARVAAFEPFAESFALLERNLALNHATRVTARRLAIGGARGEARLNLATGVAVQHSTVREGDDTGEHVAQAPLGAALDEVGIGSCDFLKLDCEGAEYSILRQAGADGTLARVRMIALEYHDGVTDHTGVWLAGFLRAQGFIVEQRPNPVHDHIGFLYARRAV